jgi:hypothetical protein
MHPALKLVMGDLRPWTSLMTSLICFPPSPGPNPGPILGTRPRPISTRHVGNVGQQLGCLRSPSVQPNSFMALKFNFFVLVLVTFLNVYVQVHICGQEAQEEG